MKEYIVSADDNGIKLIKYLGKVLCQANTSFIYKMLRKKNILLNDKKAAGNEILKASDSIKLYFSDDTFNKFSDGHSVPFENSDFAGSNKLPPVVYEDHNIIILNKPAGMLSQKAKESDISLNEICISYLMSKGEISSESIRMFKPSVINRLDRNTMGLIVFAKTYVAANILSKALKDRKIHKYYKCVVVGVVDKEVILDGFLQKDEKTNTVTIRPEDKASGEDSKIYTCIRPIHSNGKYTLLDVLLITGKTHQIRAHLAYNGHPIVGDYKYGNAIVNKEVMREYKINSQMLISYKLEMPELPDELSDLSNRTFEIDIPKKFKDIV